MRTIFIVLMLVPVVSFGVEFETSTWPGEGIPVLIANVDRLHVWAEPHRASSMREIAYRRGWRIPFTETLLRTIEATTITVKKNGTVRIFCDGPIEHEFSTGDTIEYLQYRAEGYITARYNERVCSIPLLQNPDIFGEQVDEPVVEWWVKVEYRDGGSPGWLLVDQTQNTFGRRTGILK